VRPSRPRGPHQNVAPGYQRAVRNTADFLQPQPGCLVAAVDSPTNGRTSAKGYFSAYEPNGRPGVAAKSSKAMAKPARGDSRLVLVGKGSNVGRWYSSVRREEARPCLWQVQILRGRFIRRPVYMVKGERVRSTR